MISESKVVLPFINILAQPFLGISFHYIPSYLTTSTIALFTETGRFSKTKTPSDEKFCSYCKTLNIFTA